MNKLHISMSLFQLNISKDLITQLQETAPI